MERIMIISMEKKERRKEGKQERNRLRRTASAGGIFSDSRPTLDKIGVITVDPIADHAIRNIYMYRHHSSIF